MPLRGIPARFCVSSTPLPPMRLLSVLALALSLAACASDTPSDDAPVPLATSTEAAPVAAEPVADELTADESA